MKTPFLSRHKIQKTIVFQHRKYIDFLVPKAEKSFKCFWPARNHVFCWTRGFSA